MVTSSGSNSGVTFTPEP